MIQKSISINQAKNSISELIKETNQNHNPIIITGQENNAVLLSLEDWNAIQETLYLTSIPNMRESIIQGLNTKIEDCETELNW
jgi:prevent-host-death family protein